MTKHQRQLAPLALVALELLGAAIVLRWVFRFSRELPEVQPAPVGVPTEGREAQPTGIWVKKSRHARSGLQIHAKR